MAITPIRKRNVVNLGKVQIRSNPKQDTRAQIETPFQYPYTSSIIHSKRHVVQNTINDPLSMASIGTISSQSIERNVKDLLE